VSKVQGEREDRILSAFDDLLENASFEYIQQHHPVLAHYTSIANLESILRTGELWMCHPLLSNDYEEVRFGVLEGARLCHGLFDPAPRFCAPECWETIRSCFEQEFRDFSFQHAADIYVVCFCEHDVNKTDGELAMWRGYGGRGSGAALLFSTEPLHEPDPEHPLALIKMRYGTWDQRRAHLETLLGSWARICNELELTVDVCGIAASAAFTAILYAALSWKHIGFEEEHEWRAIYYGRSDKQSLLTERLSSSIAPLLKFPIAPLSATSNQNITFSELVHGILLGPMVSSDLAVIATKRMLKECGKAYLCDRVSASRIPLREKSG
jgi:hypothetical protein